MAAYVSIIMPAFNAAAYIRESIQSVLEQTYHDWDLIVVDDGSSDGTAEVVARFTDPRIRCVTRANGGQAAARNTGIRETGGPLIAFLDADDLWLPEKLARQIQALRETKADVVYCDGYVFFESGEPERSDFFAVVPGLKSGAEMLPLLYHHNRIATLSAIVTREAVEQAGLFDESRRYQNCEDYELWLRLARAACSFYGMTDKLMRYRRHAASTTHRDARLLEPMIEVVKKHSDAVSPQTARSRIRGLYRDLVTTFLAEANVRQAQRVMSEFACWDRASMVTRCQQILLRLAPARFAAISRWLLYPAEYRLTRWRNKFRSA